MLGGPGSFPGFELGELRLTDYWTASGSYLWKFMDIMTIRGTGAVCGRATGSRPDIRTAGESGSLPGYDDDEMIYGGSLSPHGTHASRPADPGCRRWTSTDSWSLWIAVGRPIGNGTILERGIFR